jgi:hypothetical protein
MQTTNFKINNNNNNKVQIVFAFSNTEIAGSNPVRDRVRAGQQDYRISYGTAKEYRRKWDKLTVDEI